MSSTNAPTETRYVKQSTHISRCTRRGRKCMSTCIMASHRHDAVYSTEDFHKAMTSACAHGSQMTGCTMSSKRISSTRGDMRPSNEWMRDMASKTREGNIHRCFARTVALQLDWLREMRLPNKGQKIDMVVDMHLIPRYSKSYGEDLVRSKTKNGTHL